MSERIDEMVAAGKDLKEIPNIGSAISKKIQEIVERGTCKRLEELQAEMPEGLIELLRVPQLGPRKVALIYRELGVSNIEDLKKAAEHERIRKLPGMGAKTELSILEGIKNLDATLHRFPYHVAAEFVRSLGDVLAGIDAIPIVLNTQNRISVKRNRFARINRVS